MREPLVFLFRLALLGILALTYSLYIKVMNNWTTEHIKEP